MKRFLIFAGNDHYPSGGMGDFIDDFDTIDEVKDYMINALYFDWYQFYDQQERKEVDLK